MPRKIPSIYSPFKELFADLEKDAPHTGHLLRFLAYQTPVREIAKKTSAIKSSMRNTSKSQVINSIS